MEYQPLCRTCVRYQTSGSSPKQLQKRHCHILRSCCVTAVREYSAETTAALFTSLRLTPNGSTKNPRISKKNDETLLLRHYFAVTPRKIKFLEKKTRSSGSGDATTLPVWLDYDCAVSRESDGPTSRRYFPSPPGPRAPASST